MIDFVFRGGAEAGLLSGLWPPRAFRNLSRPSLQFETPAHRQRSRTNLDVLVSRLEPKHLHFHFVGSRREIGQFVVAGLIGGGHRAVIALSRDHGRARQRLPAELDRSRGCDARLRAQQRGKNHKKRQPEH